MRMRWRSACLPVAIVLSALLHPAVAQQAPTPRPDFPAGLTPEFYAHWSLLTDPRAIVPAGALTLAGRAMSCLDRPTVLNPYLKDYGLAFPRFIVINPRKFAKAPPTVQFWIYGHECGHEYLGADENKADCFGIEKGVREGWLGKDGLDQICAFVQFAAPDATHLAGPARCLAMRACYAGATRRR